MHLYSNEPLTFSQKTWQSLYPTLQVQVSRYLGAPHLRLMLAQHRPDAEGGEGEQRAPRRPNARRTVVRGRILLQFADALAKLGGQAVQLRDGDSGLVLALLQRGHEALVHLKEEAARALISLHLP